MTQFYYDPARESDAYSLPNAEVFYRTEEENLADGWLDESDSATPMGAGWYFWSCFPGCLPDSDPVGPYETKIEAIDAAREMFGD